MYQVPNWDLGTVFSPDTQYEVMQFTGLKDKNGKEIYEGDILEFTDQTTSLSKPFKIRETVKYLGCSFYPNFGANEGEIIGNIYENPDLLTLNTKE